MNQPDKPGFYIFRGSRQVRAQIYERLVEPVKVVDEKPFYPYLLVRMFGRPDRYPLSKFDGDFELLSLEDDR